MKRFIPSDMALVAALWIAVLGFSVGASLAIAIRERRQPVLPSVVVAWPEPAHSRPVLAEPIR